MSPKCKDHDEEVDLYILTPDDLIMRYKCGCAGRLELFSYKFMQFVGKKKNERLSKI